MRSEHRLGWYSLRGTAFVSVEVAKDSTGLAAVINHETTHHLLGITTSFGYVQQALETYLDVPVNPLMRNSMRHCGDLLLAASRLPQEAAATYSGLADLEGEALAASIDRLPPFYKYAFDQLEDILPRQSFPPLDRVRAARGIACRAMQTRILQDWIPRELHAAESLSAYLEDPNNSPARRLELILAGLSDLDPYQRFLWAGRHIQDGQRVRLAPELPDRDFGIGFSEVPSLNELEAMLRRILRTFSVDVAEVQLLPAGAFEIAIQPATFSTRNLSPVEVDNVRCRDVDFIMVDKNLSDLPIQAGDKEIPANCARLLLYRPDSPIPAQTIVSTKEITSILDAVDPARQATVCVTPEGELPYNATLEKFTFESQRKNVLGDLRVWTGGRRVLLHTMGQRLQLLRGAQLLETTSGAIQNHAMLMDHSWGLVLFRGADNSAPILIHPALLNEWQRHLHPMKMEFALEINVDPSAFFRGDVTEVTPILQFGRTFSGFAHTDEEWREYCEDVASELGSARNTYIKSPLVTTEFENGNTDG